MWTVPGFAACRPTGCMHIQIFNCISERRSRDHRSVIELTPHFRVAPGSSMALFKQTKQVRPRRSMGNIQATPSAVPENPEQGLGVKSPSRK